jgi:dolichol-phosphate mannosyltransferase
MVDFQDGSPAVRQVRLLRLCLAMVPPRLVHFGLVGLSGVVVDMGILLTLRGGLNLGLSQAKMVGFECATASNFWFNDRWTFGDIARERGAGLSRLKRFCIYNLVCGGGLLLSLLLLNAQVLFLKMNPYLANGTTIGLVTAWNFTLNKLFTWGPQSAGADAVPALAQRREVS